MRNLTPHGPLLELQHPLRGPVIVAAVSDKMRCDVPRGAALRRDEQLLAMAAPQFEPRVVPVVGGELEQALIRLRRTRDIDNESRERALCIVGPEKKHVVVLETLDVAELRPGQIAVHRTLAAAV